MRKEKGKEELDLHGHPYNMNKEKQRGTSWKGVKEYEEGGKRGNEIMESYTKRQEVWRAIPTTRIIEIKMYQVENVFRNVTCKEIRGRKNGKE